MSNYKVKTQVPTMEKITKRGGVLQAEGYVGKKSSGLFSIYAALEDAPDASKLPDGVPVLVAGEESLVMYVSYQGAYLEVKAAAGEEEAGEGDGDGEGGDGEGGDGEGGDL